MPGKIEETRRTIERKRIRAPNRERGRGGWLVTGFPVYFGKAGGTVGESREVGWADTLAEAQTSERMPGCSISQCARPSGGGSKKARRIGSARASATHNDCRASERNASSRRPARLRVGMVTERMVLPPT